MSDFITELTRQLRDWQDYMARADVAEMVARAAGAVLEEPTRITLRRRVNPEDGYVWHFLVVDGEEEAMLDAADLHTLQAILATYDIDAPARPGDTLTEPMRLEDGRVVTVWD
jgi:hypothetical protein